MGFDKATAEKFVKSLKEAYASKSHLRRYPGSRLTWYFQPWDRSVIPAYMVCVPNAVDQAFVMPDFVRHPGSTDAKGTHGWPREVIHTAKNNIQQNLAIAKHNINELWATGRPSARFRNGVLGPAGVLEGKTLVIIAPGPSLADNIEAVKKARAEHPEVVTMAINRAIRALPVDYILLVERWCPEGWQDLEAMKMQKDATLLTCLQAHPAIPKIWDPERTYWGNVAIASDARTEKFAFVDALAQTSLAMAVRLGYEMGAAKIILVGADFSCPIVPDKVRLPDEPSITNGRAAAIVELSKKITSGAAQAARTQAKDVLAQEAELEAKAWAVGWALGKFYFDQNFAETEYRGDPRWSNWQPLATPSGNIVGTTYEMLKYAETIKSVAACVESGSECRIIVGNPDSLCDWCGVDGEKSHPPMTLEEALAWRNC